MVLTRNSSLHDRTDRDLAQRERAARDQADQWSKYGRTSTARDVRQSADRIRDRRRGADRG